MKLSLKNADTSPAQQQRHPSPAQKRAGWQTAPLTSRGQEYTNFSKGRGTHRNEIEKIQNYHAEKRRAIRSRLDEFGRVPAANYFYECAYCLLTPQSSAVNAGKAVANLCEKDFFNNSIDPEPLLHRTEYYVRFHKTKAKHLLELKTKYPLLRMALQEATSGQEAREWLVRNIRGLGWKESSHFLRNIGYRNLAILDRHILKNLVRSGVLKKIPKSLTPKLYLEIEKKFHRFSAKLGIPMDELDLVFWSMETGEILK